MLVTSRSHQYFIIFYHFQRLENRAIITIDTQYKAIFDVSRILAIPDESVDYLQMGISGVERAELKDRGFVRTDGTKAKDYMIRTIKKTEKVGIKGDKPMPSKPVKQREYTAGADMAKKRIQSLAKQSNELRSQADELQGKILKAQNTKANRYAKGALKRRNKDNPYGLESDGMGQSFTKSAQNIRAMEAERDRLTQESEKLFQKTIRLRNVWGDKIYAKEKQDSQNGVLKNAIAYYESDSKPKQKSEIASKPTTGDAETDKRYDRLKAKKNLSPVESNLLKTYESRLNADPSQWQSGDKVGYKVLQQGRTTQTNKGFEVVSVDPKTKTATVKPIRDTGLTSTGDGFDSKKTSVVHVAELVREKSNKSKPTVRKMQVNSDAIASKKTESQPAIKEQPKTIKSTGKSRFKENLKAQLDKAVENYSNKQAKKRLSPEAFADYAKQDVKDNVVRKSRRKLIDNTTKLVSPLREKGRVITSSNGYNITRKKREKSAADITRDLERKGQLNIFNQPKPSPSAAIAPETAKKIKKANNNPKVVKGKSYTSTSGNQFQRIEIDGKTYDIKTRDGRKGSGMSYSEAKAEALAQHSKKK